MDGRPHVEIKLRFKIPPAWSGRGRICCAHNQWQIVFFFALSCRHSFSEDTWVKFSNLSEDRIIGTHDATAHVSIVR